MSTVSAILRSYRAPREVMRAQRASGADEGLGLMWLFIACILFFIARLPALSRQSHFASLEGIEQPVASLALPIFYGTVLLAPFMFLMIAAGSHLVAKLFGGQGEWLDARLALFWALLCTAPVVLFQGMVAGFVGPGPGLTLANAMVFGAFMFIWINCLWALERPRKEAA